MVPVYTVSLLSEAKEKEIPSPAKRLEPMSQFCRILLRTGLWCLYILHRFAGLECVQKASTVSAVIIIEYVQVCS